MLKARILKDLATDYGLIETLRWSKREGFIRLDLHLDRLSASAAKLGFRFDRAAVEARLASEASSWDRPESDQRVRLQSERTGALAITGTISASAGNVTIRRAWLSAGR